MKKLFAIRNNFGIILHEFSIQDTDEVITELDPEKEFYIVDYINYKIDKHKRIVGVIERKSLWNYICATDAVISAEDEYGNFEMCIDGPYSPMTVISEKFCMAFEIGENPLLYQGRFKISRIKIIKNDKK